MNLQHERMQTLCEMLNLPFVAQAYPVAAQDAAQQETPYSDFLEGLLRAEAAGRNVRKQNMLTRLAGFPAIKTLDDFDYEFAQGVKRSPDRGAGRTGLCRASVATNDMRASNC